MATELGFAGCAAGFVGLFVVLVLFVLVLLVVVAGACAPCGAVYTVRIWTWREDRNMLVPPGGIPESSDVRIPGAIYIHKYIHRLMNLYEYTQKIYEYTNIVIQIII